MTEPSRRDELVALVASWDEGERAAFYVAVEERAKGELRPCIVEGEGDHRVCRLVARHDPRRYPGGWAADAPLCQTGTCAVCGAELVSWAKHVRCPLCDEEGYLT